MQLAVSHLKAFFLPIASKIDVCSSLQATKEERLLKRLMLFISVCGSSQRPTAVGFHVVRRPARFPPNEHDSAIPRSLSNRPFVPLLFVGLHHLPVGEFLSKAAETIHQVHMHFSIIFYIFV